MTPLKALDIEFDCADLDRTLTIREYFVELLQTMVWEGEGFSGKRPFGNSGWIHDLYGALEEHGIDDGADEFIQEMIAALGEPWGE